MPVTYEEFDREWAGQRAQQQQSDDPVGQIFILALFATFPKARAILLKCCVWGFLVGIILVGLIGVLIGDNGRFLSPVARAFVTVFFISGLGLTLLSPVLLIGLWVPSTFLAKVVPKMKDRWLGIDDEEDD